MPRIIFLVCTVLVFLSSGPAIACTWFKFFNDKNNSFLGRTMEWPGDLQAEIAIFPRGHSFETFKAKYGFVGIHHLGGLSDGLNEHGLAVSALWLSESKYADKSKAHYSITELIPYLLGNTKTVEEALEFIRANQFYTGSFKQNNKIEITLHFAITDASGRSVVVEFIDGKAKIYENKVGVMTNEPTFDKHLQLWSAYNPANFNEETFEGFDYSPEGRFARMAAFNATQTKVATDEDAINRAWSMLNTVDIPKGILYWRWVDETPQFTSYALVVDIKNRVYYFRTYENYDVRKVDLSKINFSSVKYRSASLFGYANYQEFKFK